MPPESTADHRPLPDDLVVTDRTTHKRAADRGSHARAEIYDIVDEALVCHVGFTTDEGPVVIPTVHARLGDDLLIHGSPASRMLRTIVGGIDVCVTVTLLDGLVLARSAFHHSMNYRSVVAFGRARLVDDDQQKAVALDAFVDHLAPGRREVLRAHTDKELRATQVLSLPLTEASAKCRTGGPIEDPGDLGADVWAGVLPLSLSAGMPIPDGVGAAERPFPAGVAARTQPDHQARA